MCRILSVRRDLIVGDDPPVMKLDVARVPLPVVAEHGHQSQFPRRLVGFLDGRVVALEIGIAVEHEEGVAQQAATARCNAPAVPRSSGPSNE